MKVIKGILTFILFVALMIGSMVGLASAGVWLGTKDQPKPIKIESTNCKVTIENKETYNTGTVKNNTTYYKLVFYTQDGISKEQNVSAKVYNSVKIGDTILANRIISEFANGTINYRYELITEDY